MLQNPIDGEIERENKGVKKNSRDNNDNSIPTWFNAEEKVYGLGKVRTIEKYTNTFGIDLSTKTVQQHMCRFVGAPMNGLFIPHLRNDNMGIDYDKITFQFLDPVIYGNTWELIGEDI